jgi:hypothetical protein
MVLGAIPDYTECGRERGWAVSLMSGVAARRASLAFVVMLALGACSHRQLDAVTGADNGVNELPTNYKSEILSAMHAYLNDPTGIRDTGITAPELKSATAARRAT